jgi:hypothetical protein
MYEQRTNKKTITSNERSNVAPKFRPHLFWREMEEVVGALKTKSCLSEASSFCLAETLAGVAQKVQTANFLCFVSFVRAKEMKSPRGLSESKATYLRIWAKQIYCFAIFCYNM